MNSHFIFKSQYLPSILFFLGIVLFLISSIFFVISYSYNNKRMNTVATNIFFATIIYCIFVNILYVYHNVLFYAEYLLVFSVFLTIIFEFIPNKFNLFKQKELFSKIIVFILLCFAMYNLYFEPLFKYIIKNPIRYSIIINLAMWVLIYLFHNYIKQCESIFINSLIINKPAFVIMNFVSYFIILYLNLDLVIENQNLINKLILVFTINTSCVTLIPEIIKGLKSQDNKNNKIIKNGSLNSMSNKSKFNETSSLSILNVFKHINKSNGFIVPTLFFAFNILKKISFFPLFRKCLELIFGIEFGDYIFQLFYCFNTWQQIQHSCYT